MYSLRFIKFSKYVSSIIGDHSNKMNTFVSGMFDFVVIKCRTAILVHDIDIFCLWCIPNKFRMKRLKNDVGKQKGKNG